MYVHNLGKTVQDIKSKLLVKRTLEVWQERTKLSTRIWICQIYGKIVRSSTQLVPYKIIF